ncbi:AAA family ATPase [Schleiferilactobacillus harbinensis]|uniref:AAA family ATPase n=1 Tax=Schleiferilactobacillus harbinensis TaxID=304207 RepID=UPI001166DD97|nr:ATP-binding protein [Schleiferilactobacillus harbinensis]GEK07524.1 hypothetical protein LHA01_27630 [Schleiferilactobacillus harbinensis]
MLIHFFAQNFRSLNNINFSMETGERLQQREDTNTFAHATPSVLKSIMFFGANGAGKTNIIDALRTMQQIITHPLAQAANFSTTYTPFLFGTEMTDKPTTFSLSFVAQNVAYFYDLAYTRERITSESLSAQINGTNVLYFVRELDRFANVPNSLKSVAAVTRPNELFLHRAYTAGDRHAANVVQWFANDLIFFTPTAELSKSMLTLLEDPQAKAKVRSFLQAADIKVQDLVVYKLENGERRLSVSHNIYAPSGSVAGMRPIPFSAESKGTQKMIMMALTVLTAQQARDQKVIVFDGFSDFLHEEVSGALLRLFNSAENRNQFILTTHTLSLLNAELRADQIFFVEKDFQGESQVYSLFDIKDVPNTQGFDRISNLYKFGTFGAIPDIDRDQMRQIL